MRANWESCFIFLYYILHVIYVSKKIHSEQKGRGAYGTAGGIYYVIDWFSAFYFKPAVVPMSRGPGQHSTL